MKVLITGGAGFIGANLTKKYIEENQEVLIIDNYSTSSPNNLTKHKNLEVVEGTIADKELVQTTFKRFNPDIVFHAAASYKDPDNWLEDIRTNVEGTVNIVEASKKHNIKRIVYFQTALCYGTPKERPITLKHPLAPFTSYSLTKTAGENFIKLSGLSYVSLRLANIYGPMHLSGPIPTFYKRLKEGKSCFVVDTKRDFLDISDLIALIDKILVKGENSGCFNVSSGNEITIKELFETIKDEMGIALEKEVDVIPPEEDDVSTLFLDSSETEKVFGWKVEKTFYEGIKNLIAWYNENGVEQAYTHLKIGTTE